MAEPVSGMRGTKYSAGTEGSLVRDVSDKIYLLQPDDTPLTVFTRQLGGKKVADNPKFEWVEDALIPNVIADSTGVGTSTTITVTAGQETRVRIGDILIAPNGESILVTNTGSGSLTVTRAMSTTPAAYTLAAADQLIIAGNALEEGSTYAPFRYTKKEFLYNYVQIFKDSVELTEVQNASKSYGGDDRKYQQMKKAIEHKRAIEQAFLFGARFENTSGSQTRRGTGGLIYFISTNVTDIAGTITESDFEAFLRTLFRYHPTVTAPSKLLIANPVMVSAVNFWAKQALQINQNEKTFGVRVAKYRSGHGDLDIVKHWLLSDFATLNTVGTSGFGSFNFAVDPTSLRYRNMAGLDTKMVTDTQDKTETKTIDEFRTVCGLEVREEKTHGILKGVRGFAA